VQIVLSFEFTSSQYFSAVIKENPEAYCIFDYRALTVQLDTKVVYVEDVTCLAINSVLRYLVTHLLIL